MSKEELIKLIIDENYKENITIIPSNNFTVEDLEKKYNGKCLFEYILKKDNISFSTLLIDDVILKSFDLTWLFVQYYKYFDVFIKNIPLEYLTRKINDNEILFDYLLQKNVIINENIISKSFILMSKYIMSDEFLFDHVPSEFLFEKINETDTLIDYVLKNNKIISNLDRNDPKIIKKYFEHKNKTISTFSREALNSCFSDLGINQLISYLDDDFFMNYVFPKLNIKELNDYLIKNKIYDKLIHSCEELLLEQMDGKTVIECLLDNNFEPDFCGYNFQNLKIFDILFENDKIDLIIDNIDPDKLFEQIDLNVTRLDILIDKYFENPLKHNFYINNINSMKSFSQEADLYIKFAKLNIVDHLPKIGKFDIWTNLIDELLKKDRDLTLKSIIPSKLLRNPDFIIKINMCGILDETSDFKYSSEYTGQLIEDYNTKYANVEIDKESSKILADFEKLMNDGKSDPNLINILIGSYRRILSTNKVLGMLELQQLIQIKINNPDNFIYKKIDDGSYFDPYNGDICMESAMISTLNHETGHAIHYYLTDYKTPDNFDNIINKLLYDEETLRKVNNYSKQYVRLLERVLNDATKGYERKFNDYYTPEKIKEINEFLNNSREEKKEYLSSYYETKNISESVIDPILDNVYSCEKYIEAEKRIYINEFADSYLRSRYSAFIALGDIFDAIYKGKFRSEELGDDSNKIKGAYGHGVRYYSDNSKLFKEIVANYSSIIKSPNCDKALEIMNEIFGSEFMKMLNDFYLNELLNSQKYIDVIDMEEDKTL